MATRPLAFGARFRDKGRTVLVEPHGSKAQHYVVEVRRRGGKTVRRDHSSLSGALREFASAWRNRLH